MFLTTARCWQVYKQALASCKPEVFFGDKSCVFSGDHMNDPAKLLRGLEDFRTAKGPSSWRKK